MRFLYVTITYPCGYAVYKYRVTPYFSGENPNPSTYLIGQILDTGRILFQDGRPDAEFRYIDDNGDLHTTTYLTRLNSTRPIRNAIVRELKATVPALKKSEVQAQASIMMRLFGYDERYKHKELDPLPPPPPVYENIPPAWVPYANRTPKRKRRKIST